MLWEELHKVLCGGEVHVIQVPSRSNSDSSEAEVALLPLLNPLSKPHLGRYHHLRPLALGKILSQDCLVHPAAAVDPIQGEGRPNVVVEHLQQMKPMIHASHLS